MGGPITMNIYLTSPLVDGPIVINIYITSPLVDGPIIINIYCSDIDGWAHYNEYIY
jgi:hypothetical protein